MDIGTTILLISGLLLTFFGAKITFTEKGLDEMYKSGVWKKSPELFNEKDNRRLDQHYRGGKIFVLGLILLISSLLIIYFKLTL